MKSVALIAVPFVAACYGAAPPKPAHVQLPMLESDAQINVFSESTTEIENVTKQSRTCPDHPTEDNQCVTTNYTVAEPVTRTKTTATYANQPINYGQFKVLTDSHYDEKLARLDDLAHKCQRANIPRYTGIGLIVGGLVGGLIAGGAGAGAGTEYLLMYGGAGAGLVSYALGYFAFGGRDCVEARGLYNEVNVADQTETQVSGGDAAVEMKTLAEQFNSMHGMARSAHLEMRH